MVPDLLLPLRSTEHLDTLEVSIPLFEVLSVRNHRASSWRHDDFDLSLPCLPVDGTFIGGSIGGDSTNAMLNGIEKRREDLRVVDGFLGEVGRNDEPTFFDSNMKLLPTLVPPTAMFGSCPFPLPKGLEAGCVEENMEGSTLTELRPKCELELPASSNQRGMVRNVEVAEAKKLEKRSDETFGLAPRQGVLETEKQSELDDGIRVTTRSALPTGLSRLPRAKKIGREVEGQGASLHQTALVSSPVGDPIPGLVGGVNLRALPRPGILSHPSGSVHRIPHQRRYNLFL